MERSVLLLASAFATLNFLACTQQAAPVPSSPILAALQANGYFDTMAAIAAAGGVDAIYAELGPDPKTILTPTQAGWTAIATSLGYASVPAMLSQIPAAKLKALLQYNCLPTPRSSADIGQSKTMPTCLRVGGTPVTINVNNDPSFVAVRDAACTVIPLRYRDIPAGTHILQGTDRLAIAPGVLSTVDMLRSNPFLATEVQAFGNAPLDLLTQLGGLKTSYTAFVPTTAGLDSAIVSIGPTDLGLTPNQIADMLRYQIVVPALTPSTSDVVNTLLLGHNVTINVNGAPVIQTSVSTDFTTIPPVKILQASNVGSDGNNIYCVDTLLFPKVTFCGANPDTTKGVADCTNASATAETCDAIKIASAAGDISVSACAFTAATCDVNLDNEAANCATYGAGDPLGGTVCMQHATFCTWVPATPPETVGSCNPVGGAGTDAAACATFISGNVIADAANCNSVLDPEFSMCIYSPGTCDPDPNNIAQTCAVLVNTDCVAPLSATQSNADFCALQ